MYRFINNLISSELLWVKIFILLISHLLQSAKVVGVSRKQFSEKLFWLHHQKHISFPRGIVLKLVSGVEVPLWTLDEALTSTMTVEVPIKLELDKLSFANTLKRKSTIPFQPRSDLQYFRSKRQAGNITINTESSYCTLGQKQRIKILKKFEGALTVVGLNGTPCLLRAICEFQEFSAAENYGLLGELTKLLFSIKDKEGECQNDFIKAEERGRRLKCSDYHKLCSKSLFKWKTNYLPYFSGVI